MTPKSNIQIPKGKHDKKNKALPARFLVMGRIRKKYPNPIGDNTKIEIKAVTVEVVPLYAGGPAVKPQICSLTLKGCELHGFSFLNVDIGKLDNVEIMVVVKAYWNDHPVPQTVALDQATIRLWLKKAGGVKETNAPTIDYPDPASPTKSRETNEMDLPAPAHLRIKESFS